MKQRHKLFACSSTGWLCLLFACATATAEQPAGNAEPADNTASTALPAEEQEDAQPQDIIDRLFAPLDNAVSDINRDLNKNNTDAASEPQQ